MAKVITFSRVFPAYHPKKGQPTYFVEKLLKSFPIVDDSMPDSIRQIISHEIFIHSALPKHHTIRSGNRFKVGDYFSPRVWSCKPYKSKQIIISPDIQVKKVWDFEITTENDDGESDWSFVTFKGKSYTVYGYGGYDNDLMVKISKNDGLEIADFYDWLAPKRTKQEKINNEPKIFKGQIICWNENIDY